MGKKLKCLVIDDDPTITDLIQHYCDKHESVDYCLAAHSAVDGLRLISSDDFDLIFLDYNMPEMSGKALLDLKRDTSQVIMVTSHAEFAVESYNYDSIIDYLLKPISFDRFKQALSKVRPSKEETSKEEVLFIKDGKRWVKIKTQKVSYIKSDSNYVTIYTIDQKYVTILNLKDLINELPVNFKRVHRSYIVNLDYMEYLTSDEININGTSIPISLSYKDEIQRVVNKNQ